MSEWSFVHIWKPYLFSAYSSFPWYWFIDCLERLTREFCYLYWMLKSPRSGTKLRYCILTAKMPHPHNGVAVIAVILYIWVLCNDEMYWGIFSIFPSEVDDMLCYYSWLFSCDQIICVCALNYQSLIDELMCTLACVWVFYLRYKLNYSLANASCCCLYDIGESNFFMAAWSGLESFSPTIGSFHYLQWPRRRCVSDIQW